MDVNKIVDVISIGVDVLSLVVSALTITLAILFIPALIVVYKHEKAAITKKIYSNKDTEK